MTDTAVNVFELFAKIGLDTKEYEESLGKSESKFKSFGKALGNGLKTAAKVGTAAIGAAATGVVALTKQAVESYAEYEQLVGGAELMFGKAYDTVAENAKKAYATVQMSQSEYLQQVNGFATGLKTALGGNEQAAAELADRIVTAEADIIAATGNTAENVQNAFNGIMKSNFTMLDNLQIGITPTKEGFQEVIDKVNDWNKANGEATNYQMGNLADMQSALVDYIDMVGMSGYAQAEAARTISGSLASTKAAWSNLITGLADDNANVEELVSNFVTSVAGDGTEANPGLIGNILPRVEIALSGAGQLVSKLVPIIIDEIPKLIETVMPNLITAVSGLVTTLSTTISSNASKMLDSALDLIVSLGGALIENAPMLIDTILSLITQLATFIRDNVGTFAESAIDLIVGLAGSLLANLPEMIPAIVSIITELVNTLTEPANLAMLLEAALAIVIALAEGIILSIPEIVGACIDIITNIVSIFTSEEQRQKIVDTALGLGKRLVEGLWEGVKAMAGWLKDKLFGWFDDLIGDVKEDQEIHSPSRKWARVLGKPMGQGVGVGAVEGLEEAEKLIQGEINGMTASVTADVNSSYSRTTKSPAEQTNDLLYALLDLFESGNAKMDINNTRDLRRALASG